ncbi:MAG: tetratricopeptide repeat protein, partial [Verrucomicrobia bacterium]|nr:tetratricopeptide repeat protein [Verrucomicrobiota bacterium]
HDRYGIINGILWSMALAGVMWQFRPARAKPALALSAGLVILLAAMSWRQTGIWHSDLPFFTDMAAKLRSPHYRSQALLKLGNAHADLGDDAKAVASYREALQLSPSSATFHLHFNLGNSLARLTHWADATAAYETALRLKPDSAAAHLNHGVALAAKGELDRAVEHLTRALQLDPQSADAHAQLAEAFIKQGKTEQARQHAAEAERLRSAESPK